MSAELKECPFCGNAAKIATHRPFFGAEWSHAICCNSCFAFVGMMTEADAIAAWNRRAALARTPAEAAVPTIGNQKIVNGCTEEGMHGTGYAVNGLPYAAAPSHAEQAIDEQGLLIKAAEEYASGYEEPDACKADILNAFYAGSDWKRRAALEKKGTP